MLALSLVILAASGPAAVSCPEGTQPKSRQTSDASQAWCEDAQGRREGPRAGSYTNGTPWFTGAYHQGQRTGEWKFWFPSGKLRTASTYEADRRHGPYQAWHETGATAERGSCDHGVEAGTWSRWYPSGKPELEIDFVKGKPGARRYYTRRGSPTDLAGFVAAKAPGASPQDARYQQLLAEYGRGAVFNACGE